MRIDLHTHSDRSDGTDGPADLVAGAAAAGLDIVALTDHDTADGWAEAAAAARSLGVGLVPGIEISCRHDGVGVHLLAYLPDPGYPPLHDELDRVLTGRAARLPQTVARLREHGIDITVDDVHRVAEHTAATGRPHVADALVAAGVVRTREQAFDRYLSNGRVGYVDRYGADLVDMVGLVAAAGGVTVVAHPWGRRSRSALDAAAFEGLRRAGLTGVEVDHHDHDAGARAELRDLAAGLGLVATGSSDYHGAGKLDCPLGANLTGAEEFEALLESASAAAARSGRRTPEAVLP